MPANPLFGDGWVTEKKFSTGQGKAFSKEENVLYLRLNKWYMNWRHFCQSKARCDGRVFGNTQYGAAEVIASSMLATAGLWSMTIIVLLKSCVPIMNNDRSLMQGRKGFQLLIPVGRASSPSIKCDRQDACHTKM